MKTSNHVDVRELTVVIAADKNFSVPLGIAILSLIENANPSTKYDIYVLDDHIEDRIKQQVDCLTESANVRITYLNISDIIDNVPVSIFFPRVAFARFLIPQLLPHKKKILYTDADVLILEDLTHLFNIEMEGTALAACPDINLARKSQRHYFSVFEDEYGIQFYKKSNLYFHSGFLLFNCELWRAGNFTKKIFDLARSKFSPKIQYYDQDFMNIACIGNIKRISSRYCCVPLFETHYYSDYDSNYDDIENFETPNELREAYEKPAIIHYAGKKPIVFRKPEFRNEAQFFDVWKKSPWNERLPYLPQEILALGQYMHFSSEFNTTSVYHASQKLLTVALYTDNLVRNNMVDRFIQTLISLCNQPSDLFEILVIDNRSNDGTLDLLNKCKELGILKYITDKCTISEYCGYASKESTGKYVHFVELGETISYRDLYKTVFSQGNFRDFLHLLSRNIFSRLRYGIKWFYRRIMLITSSILPLCIFLPSGIFLSRENKCIGSVIFQLHDIPNGAGTKKNVEKRKQRRLSQLDVL